MSSTYTIGTLATTGNTSLGGNLTVTGTITNTQDCTIAGGIRTLTCGNISTGVIKNGGAGLLFNNENCSQIGNVAIGGTLGVTGATTLASVNSGAITSTGASQFGSLQSNGTLQVSTTSNLVGNVTCSGTLSVAGTSTLTGAVGCGALTSTGAVSGSGHLYTGSIANSAAGTTVALASKAGTATFTGVTVANAGTQNFTISNGVAGSGGIVTLSGAFPANCIPVITSVTWTTNTSIVIGITNQGSATSGSISWVFSFISFN